VVAKARHGVLLGISRIIFAIDPAAAFIYTTVSPAAIDIALTIGLSS
jgi:hypothetical protein